MKLKRRLRYRCSVPGCKPKNHDICLCGHHRMDHLEIPRDEGGGCWGTGTDCWPRCLTFEHAMDEDEPQRFFEAYMAACPQPARMSQEEADAFRAEWLAKR